MIFSSSDFNVEIDYHNNEDVQLKHKVTRPNMDSNDYNLTIIVPTEVTGDFKATVVLTHPYTKF